MRTLYPLLAADVVLFTVLEDRLEVLLLKRDNEPFRNHWALPGALVNPKEDESLDATARRALQAKTSVSVRHLEQVGVFSGAARDPRGYSVSVLYFALLPLDEAPAVAGAKAQDVVWAGVRHLRRPLAFDHEAMIEQAAAKLRAKVEQATLPLHLLPAQFTLTELQRVCEAILGKALDKSSFRRRLRTEKSLVEVRGQFQYGSYRPAQLYRAAADFRFQ